MASIFISCLRFALGILIVTVNSITVAAFSTVERLRTHGNKLVISLAVTDVMVGIILTFAPLDLASDVVSASKAWCVLRVTWVSVACTASAWTIVEIAVERYLYIVKPYLYDRFVTPHSLAIVITTTWIASTIYGTVPIYVNRFSEGQVCDIIESFSYWHSVYLAICNIVLGLVIAGVLYTLIFRLALKKLNEKACKQSVVVALIFVICWAPYLLASMWHMVMPISFTIRSVIASLGALNSGCNFFVYVLFNPCFRNTVRRCTKKSWNYVTCRSQ